jgi:5-methylcytosine-specific restriction endonuclease McrA
MSRMYGTGWATSLGSSALHASNNRSMSLPDWQTFSGGTTKRAALWLATEVGEGEVFTKTMLRRAFPSVTQIDRRVRDLRDEGWIIQTNREDPSLERDEQRLAKVGGAVWEGSYKSVRVGQLSATERQAVFRRDGYVCCVCGISAGETYADSPLDRAKLLAARLESSAEDGERWRTVCQRCHRGKPSIRQAADVLEALATIAPDDQTLFVAWVMDRNRPTSAADRLWSIYERLPDDEKMVVLQAVKRQS